jgi:hypothetical protein
LSLALPAAAADDVAVEYQKAAAILDKHIEATGGIENYDKIQNRYAEGALNIPAMGLDLEVQMWTAKPDKYMFVASSPALGKIERGTDGKVFWEKSLMTGPRIIEGAELAEAKLEARFDKYVYWRDVYKEAAYAGEDSVEGKLCDKVVMTSKEGKQETLFFDKDTHLLLKMSSVAMTQMGEIPADVFLEDYREVDGLKMPFATRISSMGQSRAIVMDSVAQNIEFPDSIFVIPEEIVELMESADTTGTE